MPSPALRVLNEPADPSRHVINDLKASNAFLRQLCLRLIGMLEGRDD